MSQLIIAPLLKTEIALPLTVSYIIDNDNKGSQFNRILTVIKYRSIIAKRANLLL